MSASKFSKFWYAVIFLLLANAALWLGLRELRPAGFGKLYFFGVSSGEAIYFRTVQGNDIVIDGGPGDAISAKLGEVMPMFDHTIELLVLTQPGSGYVSGLISILKHYEVKQVLYTPLPSNSATYNEFVKLIQQKKIKTIIPQAGLRLYLDDATAFDVFYPLSRGFAEMPSDLNEISLIGRLTFGKEHILLPSAAPPKIQDMVANFALPLHSELLKAPPKVSTNFLQAVAPEYAVISATANANDTSSSETQIQNAKILRLDQQGDIRFAVYPDHLELLTN